MRLRTAFLGTLVLTLACGGLGGGGGRKNANNQRPNAQDPAANPYVASKPANITPSGPDDRTTKVELLLDDCVNLFSPRAFDSRDRYFSWCDPGKGPTGKEQNIYGLYTFPIETSRCRDAIEKAKAMNPPMPEIEQAAATYFSAISTLEPQLVDADRYYDHDRYKLDDMGHGREIHGKLVTGFETFALADARLVLTLDKELDTIEAAMPDPTKGAPSADGYTRLTGILAKRATRLAFQAQPNAAKRLSVPDPAAFKAAVQDYDKGLRAFEAWADQTHDESSEGYLAANAELLESLTNCLGLVTSGEALDDMDISWIGTSAGWMVDGSPDEVARKYGEVVDKYNDRTHPHQVVPTRRKLGMSH